MDSIAGGAGALLRSANTYLAAHIPEVSYFLATMVMVFLSDQLMGRVLIKRLKKLTFFSRTAVFVAYSLLALPAMTIAGAALLRYTVLEAFQGWMLPALALAFLLTGVLLSSRYNMRLK